MSRAKPDPGAKTDSAARRAGTFGLTFSETRLLNAFIKEPVMPRHRLTEAEIADFRTRILREATAIVGRVGTSGLSMRALGKAVGLTPGALYRYFSSRQELLWAMWEHAVIELRVVFAELSSESDPLEAVRGMLRAYSAFALADTDRFRALFLENDQGTHDLLVRDPNALAPYDALRNAVAVASRRGLLRAGDADRLSQILWASVHGALTLAITIREVHFGDVDALVNEAMEAVLRGLKPEEALHAD